MYNQTCIYIYIYTYIYIYIHTYIHTYNVDIKDAFVESADPDATVIGHAESLGGTQHYCYYCYYYYY